MPSAHHPHTAPTPPPIGAESWQGAGRSAAGLPADSGDAPWQIGLRALMLLTNAAHPADAMLGRLSNDDLAMLRAALALLGEAEPTSAA
jgi:hypothetical protein